MSRMYTHHKRNQKGAVSLFIVIFTALLVTTITISFMQLMVRDQQQASNSDLSESAYDSAVAGVEDAKRALLMQQDCTGDSSPRCNAIRSAISSGQCSTLSAIFGGSPTGEVTIMQSEGDRALEQAYTCVKVAENTSDYVGSIDPNISTTLIPLRAASSFDKIVIHWGLSKTGGPVDLTSGTKGLPNTGDSWPTNRPALLRTQLINGHDSFHLSDFNNSGYSNTLFMYPSKEGTKPTQTAYFSLDGRRGATQSPDPVECQSNVSSGAYACQVTIDVGSTISANSQATFLNIAAFYNKTDYKIELLSGATPVLFAGVQPEVDSTGRANDLFRRVVSRIELNNTFNYPLSALETRNSICKNFSVTTDENDYNSSAGCDPTKPN